MLLLVHNILWRAGGSMRGNGIGAQIILFRAAPVRARVAGGALIRALVRPVPGVSGRRTIAIADSPRAPASLMGATRVGLGP